MVLVFIFLSMFSVSLSSMSPQSMCTEQVQEGNVMYGPGTNPLLQFLYRKDIPYHEDSQEEDDTRDKNLFFNVDSDEENE